MPCMMRQNRNVRNTGLFGTLNGKTGDTRMPTSKQKKEIKKSAGESKRRTTVGLNHRNRNDSLIFRNNIELPNDGITNWKGEKDGIAEAVMTRNMRSRHV